MNRNNTLNVVGFPKNVAEMAEASIVNKWSKEIYVGRWTLVHSDNLSNVEKSYFSLKNYYFWSMIHFV